MRRNEMSLTLQKSAWETCGLADYPLTLDLHEARFTANFRIADYPEVVTIGPLRVHATERHHPLLQTVVGLV